MKIKFNESYHILRYLTLKAELAGLPNVKVGELRGRPIVRVYYRNADGRICYRSHFVDTSKGRKYSQIAVRRTELLKEIRNLERYLSKQTARVLDRYKVRISKCILDDEFWREVGNDENPRPKRGSYYHNGIQMRSRTEVLIAEILDELGLEYKYEPGIRFGEDVFFPDFLVFIPGLKRCLIIEFVGMSDDEGYLYNNVHKVAVYANSGLIMNRDVIGLFGTKESMVSNEYIYNCIVTTVNLLVAESVQLE